MHAFQSPKDSRDWSFEGVSRGDTEPLPDEFSRPTLPSRDQGKRSTCVAFVGSTICEVLSGSKLHFSPEFIYFHRDNIGASGMYGRNLFKILRKFGCSKEHHFPYQSEDTDIVKPSERLYNSASEHKISAYARVKTIDGLKRAIVEVGPAYLLLPLYETRPEFWARPEGLGDELPTGHRPSMSCITGSHAVAVIGYTYEGFILKNSWGADWNDNGTIILKYKYWINVIECWIPYRGAVTGIQIIENSVGTVDTVDKLLPTIIETEHPVLMAGANRTVCTYDTVKCKDAKCKSCKNKAGKNKDGKNKAGKIKVDGKVYGTVDGNVDGTVDGNADAVTAVRKKCCVIL
tara:strand:- start:99257 stop:100294 length:1038 start_codon:yes stop_codon:yes gene_type:complete